MRNEVYNPDGTLEVTTSLMISSDGIVTLECLIDNKTNDVKPDWLWMTFYRDKKQTVEIAAWDNPDWIQLLGEAINNDDVEAEQYKAFVEFCEEEGLNFEETKDEILKCFLRGIELGLLKFNIKIETPADE
tara:strand:- start:6771 stop:7163 length:393 start_codon:yes stop_codon:yes gene_type:complete